MDITTLQLVEQFISSTGFPIAACCAMFWLCNRQNNVLTEIREILSVIKDKLDI